MSRRPPKNGDGPSGVPPEILASVRCLPARWRKRLPDPETYYRQHIARLGAVDERGWATGLCPFHEDHSPSFGAKLTSRHGGWICYAGCGSGDLIEFHMRRTGMRFCEAVRDLVEGTP